MEIAPVDRKRTQKGKITAEKGEMQYFGIMEKRSVSRGSRGAENKCRSGERHLFLELGSARRNTAMRSTLS